MENLSLLKKITIYFTELYKAFCLFLAIFNFEVEKYICSSDHYFWCLCDIIQLKSLASTHLLNKRREQYLFLSFKEDLW